ncbi:MAG TPA: orotate phosphoribosyltransferase [Candidatus Omnitrophota bacterium]|nr:orotate phosphoribosyltransferase [Candidatus Omnitrophota bacterium]HPD84805.1 orotate phosphoribosyltransferase [Candidatus Omnitrophota bacterium]HRZ03663.1 orotate phosphoribosyltransferase [Candidatus Omnitrophota bacterium]
MTTTTLAEDKKRLLEILKTQAFFKEKITLSSGKQSDFYIDARRVTLSPEGSYLCAKIILELIKDDRIDAIGGPTLGADPLAGAIAALSFQAKKPVLTFIVRKAPKPYGKQQQVEGPLLNPGARVAVIDDVATSGKSLVQSIDVLEQLGLKVVKAVCIVDRKEGAVEALAGKKCPLVSIFQSSDFLK